MGKFGPQTERVEFVRDEHVPNLTALRADVITERAKTSPREANDRALTAARLWGREEQTVLASEELRRAIWTVVWDSTWPDAWVMQWIAARVGVGLATQDLIGLGDYTIEDYVELVAPWTTGFPDMPIPLKEERAA